MATIAELSVLIGANISGLTRGMQDANQSVDRFARDAQGRFISVKSPIDQITGSLDGMASKAQSAAGTLAGVFAPAGLALGFAVNTAATFEDSLTELSVRTGTYGEELEAIRLKALEMGEDTAFSAQQSLDAFLQLVTSGSTVEEAFAQIGPVLDAAAASGEALGPTADIVTDIMAAFQLGASDVADGFEELRQEMGLSDQVFIDYGNDSGDAILKLMEFGDALGISARETYEMWNASKELTPEIQAMADSLDISQQQWDEYAQFLNGSGGSVSASIKSLIDETGIAGDRLFEMLNPAADAAMVVDALARAAGASSATMGDLGQGFANVGGQARAFGLDVNQTAAILAIFSENGIKGAEAGTQLRSMLTNMSRDTTDVKAAWNSLGTSMYDTAGNMRPLENILEDIRLGLDGRTEREQNEILQDLAGSYGILGLRALLGGVSIEEMQAKMEESASATEVAEARMSTFSGSFDQLKGSIETFMITAGTPFIQNVLQPMVGSLTDIVSGFTTWADENPGAASTLLGVVGAGAVAIPVLWGISSVARLASGGISAISAAVGFLGSAGTLALLGTVGAVWLLNQEIGEGVTVMDGLVFSVKAGADDIAYNIRKALAKPEDAWLFKAGDDIVTELSNQLGQLDGDPIEISSALEFTIDQNPTAIAENMSYQARTVLVAAWNRAVEQGDTDFLRDAAPLVAALDQLNLIPSELGDINLDPLTDALGKAWDENLDEIGNQIIKPGSELPININQLSILLEAQGIDPAQISSSISNQQITNALELALSAEGPLDLQVPISFSRLDDGTVDVSFLDDLLRGAAISPEVLNELASNASEDLKAAVTDALLRAYESGDQGAVELLSPVAVAMEIDIQSEAVERETRRQLELAVSTGTQADVEAAAALAISVGISEAEVLEIQNQHARLVADAINRAPATDVNSTIAVDVNTDTAAVVNQVVGDIQAQNYDARVTAQVYIDTVMNFVGEFALQPGMNHPGVGGGPDNDNDIYTPAAVGLDRVPRDGFRASLHKDEAVLTAHEAPIWRALKGAASAPVAASSGGTVVHQHFNITAYGETPDALARMLKKKMQEQAIGGGAFG